MIAATYVRDLDASRRFYELLGFHERASDQTETSAWSSMRHQDYGVLLTSTRPLLDYPPLPLMFYFFFDDLGAVVGRLRAAGLAAEHMGYPSHAPGGEVKVLDPDGNTLLLGQEEPAAAQPPAAGQASRFSLLREAAALVEAQGGTSAPCQVTNFDGAPCHSRAEVKLADSGGETVWACLGHADEILVAVPGAFIASQDGQGIARFLRSRRGPGQAATA